MKPSELDLLREFYRSWCFFHKLRSEPSNMGDVADRTRMEMASQGLWNAHLDVQAHIKANMKRTPPVLTEVVH